MPKDHTQSLPHIVRRADRAVDDEKWIQTFLQEAPYAALATVHDGQPFINTNLFVYDAHRHVIYMHTAQVGRTRANIERDSQICLSVSEMGRILPADEALEFSVEYAGVTVFGVAHIIEREEARYGLQLLLDKYAPHLRPDIDYRAITDEELKRTAVYRIDIHSWSGKRKRVEDEFPGAFWYPFKA